MSHEKDLKDAWGSYLNRYRWDAFITVTFRSPRLPHHADSTIQEVAKVIRRITTGRFFVGTELHKSRTLHVHGLLQSNYGPDDVHFTNIVEQLYRVLYSRFGRSQVRRVRENAAVSNYVTKYIVKELTAWELQL